MRAGALLQGPTLYQVVQLGQITWQLHYSSRVMRQGFVSTCLRRCCQTAVLREAAGLQGL